MFLEQKNNQKKMTKAWMPNASKEALQARARLLENIRAFFKQRNVLEVETPLLCHAAVQDPHLHPIPALYSSFGANHVATMHAQTFYLQTSPEFAMKRMLAANAGPIYQICKAFRNGEQGKIHNPEFTMVEWYQPGYDHHQLMDEVDDFLAQMINLPKAERISYQDIFLRYLDLNPFQASFLDLQNALQHYNINLENATLSSLTRDDLLNLLMTHCIEPKLGMLDPVMVFDFPASQAALAKICKNTSGFEVAERFEVYFQGMEIANGYHELTDGDIQEQRLHEDAATRRSLNHPEIPIDMHLVNALKAGMPNCAGIALGVDRLLMLKINAKEIAEVLSFTIENA